MVKQPQGVSFKCRGGQAILLRGIPTNHHGNVCSQVETTNLVEISRVFFLCRQKFVIPPHNIAYTMPRVKQPWGRTLKPRVGQSLSSAWLSIPPRVILSITILEFPTNLGGFAEE